MAFAYLQTPNNLADKTKYYEHNDFSIYKHTQNKLEQDYLNNSFPLAKLSAFQVVR